MSVRVVRRLNLFEQSAKVIKQAPHASIKKPTHHGYGQMRLPSPTTSHQQQPPPVSGIVLYKPVSIIESPKLRGITHHRLVVRESTSVIETGQVRGFDEAAALLFITAAAGARPFVGHKFPPRSRAK